MTRTATYKILGITDERTNCECCGKPNLKRTVALEINGGAVVYYGTTCAAKALKGAGIRTSKSALDIEAEAVGFAQRWLDEGVSPRKVADMVGGRFGFPAQQRNGAVQIANFAMVRETVVEDEYNAEWLAYS